MIQKQQYNHNFMYLQSIIIIIIIIIISSSSSSSAVVENINIIENLY